MRTDMYGQEDTHTYSCITGVAHTRIGRTHAQESIRTHVIEAMQGDIQDNYVKGTCKDRKFTEIEILFKLGHSSLTPGGSRCNSCLCRNPATKITYIHTYVSAHCDRSTFTKQKLNDQHSIVGTPNNFEKLIHQIPYETHMLLKRCMYMYLRHSRVREVVKNRLPNICTAPDCQYLFKGIRNTCS